VSEAISSAGSENENKLRDELYKATRAELLAQQSSNTEAYDKAVLTISAAFLAVSLAFIKDPGFGGIHSPALLVSSWGAFAFAIIACVLSFQLSNFAIEQQLDLADRYYKQGDESAIAKTRSSKLNDYLNRASGLFLVMGVILTIVFVSINLYERSPMSSSEKSGRQIFNDSQPVNRMQTVEQQRSATINAMQKVPATPAPAAPAQTPPEATSANKPDK
jgi:hypothetical protein